MEEYIENGAEIHVVCPTGHSLRCLKGIASFRNFPCLHTVAALSSIIIGTRPDLVIPADDRTVRALHDVFRHADTGTETGWFLRDIIEKSIGKSDYFTDIEGRLSLIDILRAEGITTPAAADVHCIEDVRKWCARVPGPWVLKRDRSSGGAGVTITDTPEETEACFRRLSQPVRAASALRVLLADRDIYTFMDAAIRKKSAVMAQEYIEGMPANIMAACSEGRILDTLGVDVVSYQGRTGAATLIAATQSEEMEHAARVVCSRLKLSGFFGLDFVRCAKSGTYYFIEMNPRLTQIGHLNCDGRTVGSQLLFHMRGERADTGPAPRAMAIGGGRTVALFPQILRAGDVDIASACLDVPWRHPDLVRELLRPPWSRRGYIAQLEEKIRRDVPYGKTLKKQDAMKRLRTLASVV
ncbi:hypothetical protein AOE01nite_07250 [Acetobacter oeni]|uniref:ATP-grasp domain-containing protein n=1 Tax=Acetobacter oeni TaxID=304077 RepID=A0A511XHW5_9PROT|nr:hypothetical protein AA21952_3509 [Acetobacter oeni LMG 21952]GEN62501.1 hypothetical protein AOE01nite_07250 [Acetobacter oeni]